MKKNRFEQYVQALQAERGPVAIRLLLRSAWEEGADAEQLERLREIAERCGEPC